MDISIPARVVFNIGPLAITDGLLGSVLASLILVGFSAIAASYFSLIPTKIQVAFEMVTDYVMDLLTNAFHDEARARRFFPFFITMLLFLTVANQLVLIPFIFEITQQAADGQTVDLFRQPTSDLALPLAYAIMVVFIANAMAFKISPLRYIGGFIAIGPILKARSIADLFNGFVGFFVGVLNIIGEVAKIISLSARLFGNIFAGGVMIAVIASLSVFTQYLVPLPFIVLSTFSGFVQAFVFMLLSIQFIALSIEGVMDSEEEEDSTGKEPALA